MILNYHNLNWNEQWDNLDNCAIVAYVYDVTTNEVIQSFERKINIID